MSSILKVDTIQDQNGNLIISKDSGGSGFLSPYASSSAAITYTVTVASKTSAHPYFGVGSSLGYLINGIESPIIEIKGNDTSKPYHYKFDQSDSSNSGHPLLFYNNVGKTTQFTTGVTTNGTPGSSGAYTMIAVDSQTPNILYYQCSSHGNMGNHTFATSPVVNTGVFLTLPTADGSSGQFVTTNGSGVLSFANGSVPDDAITLAKMAPGTDGNIISYDASGNPVAVATGSAAQVLTSAGAGAPPTFATATVPDDAITLAKMAPGTDGNIISYDASGNPVAVATGNDGQVLTSTGAGSPPAFETLPVGGITQADNWRINTSLTGLSYPGAVITANWERADSTGQGSNMVIGNGVSESSGIFTFPATGIYLISTYWEVAATNANDPYIQVQTLVTTNNSSYGIVSRNGQGLTKYDSSTEINGSMSNTVIIDVASTSNTKVKFYFRISGSHAKLVGSNTEGKNGVCFVRLGDT